MTEDLVAQLREYGSCGMVFEAADRIEKLEAALLDLCDGWECCAVSRSMRVVARKALEGKDER